MKRFRFRLASVLQYRKHLEQMALLDLAKAKRSIVKTKEKIQGLEHDKNDAMVSLDEEESQGIDVVRHQVFLAYLRGLSERIEIEKDRLIELGAILKKKQKVFEAERIKRESLELLRKNEYAKYIKEMELAEQKAADELMSLRWRPKKLQEMFKVGKKFADRNI